jgi:predicted deacylase
MEKEAPTREISDRVVEDILCGEINQLAVGQIGVVRIDVPVFTIGSGKPVLCISSCIHGDEPAGLFILASFIKHLQLCEAIHGTIHIVPIANPAAQFINSRVTPLDQKDLNRVGRGRNLGSFTERIGARLFDFFSQCDLVINLHEFEMHTPITAAFIKAGDNTVRLKTLNAIENFAPEMIWVIDTTQKGDMPYQLTLDTALSQAGVVNFPVEMTQLSFLTDVEINNVTQGLLRAADHLGVLKYASENPPFAAPALTRHEFSANDTGLWEPKGNLMQVVEVGDIVGTLKTLPDFKSEVIRSPISGILIQIRHRQLAVTGTSLFSIGCETSALIEI